MKKPILINDKIDFSFMLNDEGLELPGPSIEEFHVVKRMFLAACGIKYTIENGWSTIYNIDPRNIDYYVQLINFAKEEK